jgi:hypothetical protein
MRFKISNNNVNALLFEPLRLFKHPVCFAYTGCVTEKHLKPPATS